MAEADKPSDVSKLVSYVPAVTVGSLFILAVFNIGYFSKIGLHFLGVMDFSNLAYSFSFIVAIIMGSLGAALWGNYLEGALKYTRDIAGRKKLLWWILGFVAVVGITIAIIHVFFPQHVPKHILVDRIAAMIVVPMAILLILLEYADYQRDRKIFISGWFLAFILSVTALYYLGRAVAEHQIFTVKATYEFRMKELYNPIIGKILRSSSTGFLIYADERIAFLPQGEIKRVRAVDEVSDY